jgi:hypothetical protein
MEVEKVRKEELRSNKISIRTFPAYCKWMKDNHVSPSKVFNDAIKILMEKNGK